MKEKKKTYFQASMIYFFSFIPIWNIHLQIKGRYCTILQNFSAAKIFRGLEA